MALVSDLIGSLVSRTADTIVIVDHILAGGVVCIQHHSTGLSKQFVGISLTVDAGATGDIIPCCELITILAGGGQFGLVAHCQVLGGDVAAAAGIEDHSVCIHFHADPLGTSGTVHIADLQHVGAGLSQGDLDGSCTIGNGDDLTVVDLDLVSSSTDHGQPAQGVLMVVQALVHFCITNILNIAPQGFGSAHSANADSVLGTIDPVHQLCQIVAGLGNFVGLLPYLDLILGSAVNACPAEDRAIDTNVGRSCQADLVCNDLACSGRVEAMGLGVNLHNDAALASITALQGNEGLAAIADELVIVSSVATLHGNHVVSSVGDLIPDNSLGGLVITQTLNSVQISAINELTGNGGAIAFCHSGNREADTVGGHFAVSEVEGSGSAVVEIGVIMLCITANNGNQILLSVLNGVEHQHGVDHFEGIDLIQCLVDEVSDGLGVICIAGVGISNNANLIQASLQGVECHIEGGSTGGLVVDNGITLCVDNGNAVGSSAGNGTPAQRSGIQLHDGSSQLVAGEVCLPHSEQSGVAIQQHTCFVGVGQLLTVVGHTDPPALELVALTGHGGQFEQLAAGGGHGCNSLGICVVGIEVDDILAAQQRFAPTGIQRNIAGNGISAKGKGSLELAVCIPADEYKTIASGVSGFGNSLAVQHGNCFHCLAAVHFIIDGVSNLLQETHGSTVESQGDNLVFHRSDDVLNAFGGEIQSQFLVGQGVCAGLGAALDIQGESITGVQRQGIFLAAGIKVISAMFRMRRIIHIGALGAGLDQDNHQRNCQGNHQRRQSDHKNFLGLICHGVPPIRNLGSTFCGVL